MLNTRIENYSIYSDVVYPDLISNDRKFKKLRVIADDERIELLGKKLHVGNKYLVFVCGKFLYQHDFTLFECVKV